MLFKLINLLPFSLYLTINKQIMQADQRFLSNHQGSLLNSPKQLETLPADTRRPSSRERFAQLKQQEEYLSEVFKIDNFYQNEKLDLTTLKSKLNQVRNKPNNSNSTNGALLHEYQVNITTKKHRKNGEALVPLSRRLHNNIIEQHCINIKNAVGCSTSRTITAARNRNNSFQYSSRKLNDNNETKTGFRFNTPSLNKTRYQQKQKKAWDESRAFSTHTYEHSAEMPNREAQMEKKAHDRYADADAAEEYELDRAQMKSAMIPKIHSIGHRKALGRRANGVKSTFQNTSNSRLEPLNRKKKLLTLELTTQQNLAKFEKDIFVLWSLYEKMSSVTQTLSQEASPSQKDNGNWMFSPDFISCLTEYKSIVCSAQLEFLVNIIDSCLEPNHSRVVISSRLLENLSIIYVFLEIVQKTFTTSLQATQSRRQEAIESSHLVNFVGICSTNILLLIRILTLTHNISSSLTLTPQTNKILETIVLYEINSYREELSSVKQTILRIEHNNELAGIIQNKINNKMGSSRQYHVNCIGKFMKGVVLDRLKASTGRYKELLDNSTSQTKPFYEYSFFIFEYLAYHLHHEQCIGLFPKDIETAPEPYLPLTKQFTVIINATKVLIHQSKVKSKIYIRAYAQKFVEELSKKCNVVFWSNEMPNLADPLFDLISKTATTHDFGERNSQSSKNLANEGEGRAKRLYRHHCVYDRNFENAVTMVKDISRVGCSEGKYLIFDASMDDYYAKQETYCVRIPWRGEANDTKLLVILDLILPFLREGADLTKGLTLLKPRLSELLQTGKKKGSRGK